MKKCDMNMSKKESMKKMDKYAMGGAAKERLGVNKMQEKALKKGK